ncbi:aminotransferase class III-fold pyridoxal phosphate-dependent enzyme [Wenzhouxiangella sp. AB-CW3]|uniref:aminotransferase n=1 Tax=Wenzhouxiangella sp. AB-CW3 TaxID=2771012 RepID=UPI00168BF3EF|nr:aminotransferase [Wenzhouxiangella sp. AB-CW3]QOC21385.1 aminotransferase class III-fold pyridoxal phosphate-dependent enzyme [Wenzhouxiangella sp. AB-CW3]
MTRSDELSRLDLDHLFHPSTDLRGHGQSGPLIWDRGEGVYIFDTEGRKYLEGMAGLWCTALGYGEKELARVAAEQTEKFCYGPLFAGKSNEPSIRLAAKLSEWVPIENARFLFGCSGSDANDTQVKLMRYYYNAIGKPHKKKILSRFNGYHGVTLASAALTGLPAFHRHFDLPGDDVIHLTAPHHYRQAEPGESEEAFSQRLADELETVIEREGAETIAAFIAEPLMAAGGVIPPPAGYFEKIQPILAANDILFIDDEVVCGFGRTGHDFGCQTWQIRPHTMTMAKALSSAYQPISAVAVPPFMYEAIEEAAGGVGMFAHGLTYAGHPVAAAVALRNLELMEERGVMEHAARMGDYLERALAPLADHELVGNLRGRGLIAGLELVADKASGQPFAAERKMAFKAAASCLDEGLVVRALPGDTIAICPPLIITEQQIDELVEKLSRGLDRLRHS